MQRAARENSVLRFLSRNRSRDAEVTGFQHADAQRFEFEFARKTMDEAYPRLLGEWRSAKASGGLWQHAGDQWFQGDTALFDTWVEHVRGRKCLEIGSGPFGHLAPCWWIADRVVVDPLVDQYREYQVRNWGESWFEGVRTISGPAEEIVTDLVGRVDGCIVCRNALDHCEDPLAVLDAVSEYAAPGCFLLLWTDLWHLQGHDEGHHNLTRSVRLMDKLLDGLGFDVLKTGALIRDPQEFIEYGRLAVKREP